MTIADAMRTRRHLLFTMLTACAWRDTFLGGWLGIGRIAEGVTRQSYDLQLTRYGEKAGARRSTRRGLEVLSRSV